MSSFASRLRGLKNEEIRLRTLRRKIKLAKQHSSSSSSSTTTTTTSLLSHIPENRSLESTIGILLTKGRDPRVFLHLTQRLLGCTVLSLAANTVESTCSGKWDPLDVKPQVFALGKHMALPVFTSVRMMRQFCWKHDFSVRGPDGSIWVQAGSAPPDAAQIEAQKTKEREEEVKKEEKEEENMMKRKKKKNNEGSSSGKRKQKRKEEKLRAAAEIKRQIFEQKRKEDVEYEKLLASAASIEQFEMRTVQPLHIWGTPRQPPYFHGYYGLLTTVLENASILPDTDIILNPASPLELALSSNLSAKHLANRNAAQFLVHSAFQRVEKVIRKEFYSFLSSCCPEVLTARSATLRRNFGREEVDSESQFENQDVLASMGLEPPVAPELLRPDAFDIVVLIETRNFRKTAQAIQNAKRMGFLIGHASLRVIPIEDALPHVREVSETFYTSAALVKFQQFQEDQKSGRGRRRNNKQEAGEEQEEERDDDDSNLELLGDSMIVNAHLSSNDFYSNPALAYTEPHAVALRKKF